MKIPLLFCIVIFTFSALTSLRGQEVESWTNREGATMEARFVQLDGNVVLFEKPNGQKFRYEAAKLNLDGQAKVTELAKVAHLNKYPLPLRSRMSMRLRMDAVKKFEGQPKVETAARKALEWLASRQDKTTGAIGSNYTVGVTGMALLAFLGHGETPSSPKFGETVVLAALYLIERSRKEEGLLTNGESGYHKSYEHAIGTYALAELQAMTKDSGKEIPRLEQALKKAVGIIVKGQTRFGGWTYGYSTSSDRDDLSLAGWQIQALAAAKLAGVEISGLERSIEDSKEFVEKMQDEKGAFKYNPTSESGKLSLTGVGLYGLQLANQKEGETYEKAVAYLQNSQPLITRGYYSAYYATLAAHQHGGALWDKYREEVVHELAERQNEDGSFLLPESNYYSKEDTQAINTAWAALCLEVFYRYAQN